MNKNIGILLFVVGVVLMGSLAFAADIDNTVSGATVTKGSVSRSNATAIGTDIAAGGNITNMNFSAAPSTVKWQGYYGNASISSLRLGTNSATALYTWSSSLKSNVLGVFASTDSAFDFSLVTAATGSNYDTALSWDSNDADTVVNTMSGSAQTVINGAFSTVVAPLNSYGLEGVVWSALTTKFRTGIFTDSSGSSTQGDYAVGVNSSLGPHRSFDNQTAVSFELIVPVGGNNPTTGQTYNFWLAFK